MFLSGLRLRRIRKRYLESSRNLREGRVYLHQAAGCRMAFLELITPIPVMGLMPGGEHLLAALEWLETHARDTPLTVREIRHYHRHLFPKDGERPGSYRVRPVQVAGSRIARPAAPKVPLLMTKLDGRLEAIEESLAGGIDGGEVLKAALEIHQRLAYIHPFGDGNGRVARLAMNHLLRRFGQPYVILPPIDEVPEHFDALESAHRGNLTPFTRLAERHRHTL